MQVTLAGSLRKLLCASSATQAPLRKCSAQVPLRKSTNFSALRVALCKLLCASCSAQVLSASASRTCFAQMLRARCSVHVSLCKLLCASLSIKVPLRKLLCASAPCKCSAQVALRKCCVQGASVLRKLLCKLLCASLRAIALRMWSVQIALRKRSVQVALRKLLCASCSVQVALCKCCEQVALRKSFVQVALCKLLCASALRKLLRASCSVQVLPELREYTLHTTFVLTSCDFAAGAAGVYSAYYVCTYKLQFFSRSCESAPICAEGRVGRSEIVQSPQLLNIDHADLRRGLMFVECCRPYPAALRKEERNLKLLS